MRRACTRQGMPRTRFRNRRKLFPSWSRPELRDQPLRFGTCCPVAHENLLRFHRHKGRFRKLLPASDPGLGTFNEGTAHLRFADICASCHRFTLRLQNSGKAVSIQATRSGKSTSTPHDYFSPNFCRQSFPGRLELCHRALVPQVQSGQTNARQHEPFSMAKAPPGHLLRPSDSCVCCCVTSQSASMQ